MRYFSIQLLIVLAVLILLSAFFSLVEIAFASVNQVRLKTYVNKGRKGALRALRVSEHYDKALSTILVGNNFVNIAAATISSQIASNIWGPKLGVIISTFVVTLLVLIVGDILPKSLAKENAEIITLRTAQPLYLLMKIFRPVNWVLLKIPKLVSQLIGCPPHNNSFTEEEIKVMVEMSAEEGTINQDEKELVKRSLELDEIIVSEIARPRHKIIAIDSKTPIEEIKEIFFNQSISRVLVYDDNIDNVVGILSARDFLTSLVQGGGSVIGDIVTEPIYVPECIKVSVLLKKLKHCKNKLAIVTDEYGGTVGLVTLEDVLERIVGDIYDVEDDDLDEKENLLREIEPSVYIVQGEYQLRDFASFFEVEMPKSHNKTVAGWVTETFEELPNEGMELRYHNLLLIVEEVDKKRAKRIRVETGYSP